MHKQTVFVGSSSEAEEYAQLVHEVITRTGLDCHPWWSEFPVGVNFLQALLDVCAWSHAAVFIATPDDQTDIRGEKQLVARQNVLLEYGMFAGVHGSRRVAVLRIGDVSLPTDLSGVAQIHCRPRASREDPNRYKETVLAASLRPWLRSLEADHDPLRELVTAARNLQDADLLNLIAHVRWLRSQQLTVECYPEDDVLRIVKRCAVPEPATVGLDNTKTSLPYHIRLRVLDADGTDVRSLPVTWFLGSSGHQAICRCAPSELPFRALNSQRSVRR